jgi:hypothetical protein
MGYATLGPRATCAAVMRLVELGVERILIVDRDGRVHGVIDAAVIREIPAELVSSPLVIARDLVVRFDTRATG